MSRIKRIAVASMMIGGLSAVSMPIASAVVNGEPATSNVETRSIVGIQTPAMAEKSMVDNCTGAVVAPDWILTASHCVGDQDSVDEIAVVANGTTYGNTTFVVEGEKKIKTDRVVFGKSQVFKPSDGTDLALIKLPRALPGISPVTLASQSQQAGATGSLYGWGIPSNQKHESGDKLSFAPSTVVFNGLPSEHKEYLGSELGTFAQYANGTYYYTTQKDPSSAIQGDSGGPLMVDGVLTAVTSQLVSDKASDVVQGVLSTDVAKHADWIRETVGSGKASRSVDIAAGVGGTVDGKKVLPFTVANIGSDVVSDVNVEVSPPEGSELPVGSKLVVSKNKYTAGGDVEFDAGETLSVDTYTPVTSSSTKSRSFTVKVPVNLKPGEGVQLRLVVPEAVEGGDYRVLAYGVPGVRPAMFALEATNKCDQGADRDNCASVVFGSGVAQDVVVNAAGFASGVRFDSGSSEMEGNTSTISPSAEAGDSEVTSPAPESSVPSETPAPSESVTPENVTPEPSVPAPAPSPGDIVIEGKPDSRPKGEVSTGVEGVVPVERVGSDGVNVSRNGEGGFASPTVTEVPAPVEQPAASQRILADTGVSGVFGLAGVGLLAVLGGAFALRRRG